MMAYVPFAGTVGRLEALRGPVSLDINFLGGDEITLHENRGAADEIFGPIYDPAEFVYTHLDGTRYEFNPAGQIVKMADRNGNTLTFGAGGIIHSTGKSVKFIRDTSGRIVEIYDPLGLDASGEPSGQPAIVYRYDAAGNLTEVHRLVDRTQLEGYLVTKFAYEDSRQPHYITSIKDPRGITGIRNEYDGNGRLKSTMDATGKTITLVHDLNGKTETVVDRLGFTNVFKYDANGNVTNSVNALGHTNRFEFDANNNLTVQVDAVGHTNRYAYDLHGNRTEVIDALNRTNRFAFDPFGNVAAHIDPLGNVNSNRYDNAGNLTNVVRLNAQGQVIDQSFSKFVNGRLAEVRDGSNQITAAFAYDLYGNLTNAVDANQVNRTFKYDANGNQTNVSYTWSGPGGSNFIVNVNMEYDGEGKVVRSTDPTGNETRTSHNPIGKAQFSVDRFGNTNQFLYDPRGNLIQATHPNGTFTRTVYDDNGRVILATDRNQITGTRTEYDAIGRVTNTVRLTGVSIDIVPDIDNPGQMRSVIGSAGTALSANATEYLANGWVKARINADGKKTTYEYWADGQVKSVTDPLTNITYLEYDAAGHQKFVHDALNRTNRFDYDGAGRLTKSIFANNSYTSNIFNGFGHKVGHVDQAGLLTQFAYDGSGHLTNVTKPQVPDPENAYQMTNPVWAYEHDQYGRLSVIRDPKGRTNTFGYDAMGRRLNSRLPMGQTETNQYNGKGQLWKRYDFKGQKTEFVYDKFGRVAAKFYFHAGAAYPSNAVCYQHNQLDQLWKIVERSGPDATTNACNGYASSVGLPFGGPGVPGGLMARVGRIPQQVAGGLLAMLLLIVAPLFIRRLIRQRVLTSILEAWRAQQGAVAADLRRPRRQLPLPAFGWRFVTVIAIIALLGSDPHFDALLTVRAACPMPLNASTATTRITEFSYDHDGRLAQVNSPEGVINYGYDLATGRHTSTCTTNSEMAYGYDELGRLKTVSVLKRNGAVVSPPEVTTYTYTAVGSRETLTLPNGVVSTYKYDSLNRLTNLTHKAGATNLATYTYQLHATGRRTNAVEVLLKEDAVYLTNTLSWSYDGMYRLTNEVSLSSLSGGQYSSEYQYDKAGNRLKKVRKIGSQTETINYIYNDNDQLLREEIATLNGTLSTNYYAYDANGSLTSKTNATGTITYTYNLANRLTEVTAGGVTASYVYNDQGLRVRSTTGGGTIYYLLDANNHTGYAQILEELSGVGGTPLRSYVTGDDVLAQAINGNTSYLLYDGHGSTRQLASATPGITSRYNYDAYGITLDSSSSSPETDLRYCGEHFDTALQVYNLRARCYDQTTGRFNQRDRFTGNNFDPQSFHKYAYVHGDPVNQLDPSGNSIGGTTLELLFVVGIILNVASFVYHQSAAGQAAARGQLREAAASQAWAMVDLAFLLVPGGGLAGPGGKAALAYVGGRIGQTGAGLLRAGVHASAVWGYVSTMVTVATEASGADSDGGEASGNGGSAGSNEGPGNWEPEPGQWHWSPEAQAYQWQITGRQFECYFYKGTRFDGWDPVRKVFLEAKSETLARVMLAKWWQKLHDFRDVWRTWAEGRVKVAGNIPIDVPVANKELADAIREALGNKFPTITVTHTPATTVIH